MQIIKLIAILLMINSAFAYDCKKTLLKNATLTQDEISKMDRQVLFEGLLFELTAPNLAKDTKTAKILSHYLENTEVNKMNRSFLKLLSYSADLETDRPRALNFNEICEINSRLKKIQK
jgi:hypothetical protein